MGLLTKTDAFTVFDHFSSKDPESGCAELDNVAFAKAAAMIVGISITLAVAKCESWASEADEPDCLLGHDMDVVGRYSQQPTC